MTYIQPNSDLIILHDVPLDTTYEHTIYFASPSAQETYFTSKSKYTFSNLTYQRVQRGRIRIEKTADDLYNCNYLMFRNTAFGTKWFYAFITSVEYINDKVAEIRFAVDVMQTWFFDFEFKYAFVERNHTTDDDIGDHYEPEPVPIGEYVMNNYDMLDDDMYLLGTMIAVIELDNNSQPIGNLYENIYSGCKLYFFSSTETSAINSFLANYTTTPDNVVAMYMCPVKFVNTGTGQYAHVVINDRPCYTGQLEGVPALTTQDRLDGYKPRNKKLYSYPYNFLHIDNGANGELSLRYEFFTNGKPSFELVGSMLQPVEALLIPKNYKGVTGTFFTNNNKVYLPESLPLSDYPVCSWNFDSYKQWVETQGTAKAIRFGMKQGKQLINAGLSNTLKKPSVSRVNEQMTEFLNNTVDFATEMAVDSYLASTQADICKGTTSNGSMNCAKWRQTYYYGRCSVNKQSAEMLDTFFDKYGYAINKVTAPNLNARAIWTYVKTRDCTLIGSVPSTDMKLICDIFNSGITFWTSGDNVGRYDLAEQNEAPIG